MKPAKLHIHFGAGQLGIGAVLPIFAKDLNLVVVQQVRDSGGTGIDWDDIAQQRTVLFRNSSGVKMSDTERSRPPYRKWFRCLRKRWLDDKIKAHKLNFNPSQPLLLVVDHFTQVAPLLKLATRLSCSLGGGQYALGELLTDYHPANTKVHILAFENKLEGKLKVFSENTNKKKLKDCVDWPVYPAITDRICSDRQRWESERSILVQNEEYLKVIVPNIAADCFDSDLVGDKKPVCLVPAEDLPFHAWKKRSLVNSLHQLLALFCFRALSKRHIPTGGQYLPLVMAWFAKEYPHLHHSIELYERLRALELTWPMVQVDSFGSNDPQAKLYTEAAKRFYHVKEPQQLYDILRKEAEEAVERFQRASDELKRLINPENLRKELKKFDEHVLIPTRFARLNESKIKEYPLFNKPNIADLRALEDVLSESFLVAMDEAMSSPKRRSS